MRQPVEHAVDDHRVGHVQAHLVGAPHVLGGPGVALADDAEAGDAVGAAGLDDVALVDLRGLRGGRRRGGEGPAPQQLPGVGGHPHQVLLGEGDDLPHALDLGDDRRPVGGPVAVPAPPDLAGGGVERGQGAVVLAAHVQDDVVAVDDRRLAGVVERLDPIGGPLPQLPAVRGVERGHDAADAEREEAPVGVGRGRLGPGPVDAGGRHHLKPGGIARPPDGLAGGGVEGLHDLVVALPAEQVHPIADEEGRRVAEPHVDRPLPGEPGGPRRRHVEPDDRAVPVRSPPLGRVLAGRRRRRHRHPHNQCNSDHRQTFQHHSLSSLSVSRPTDAPPCPVSARRDTSAMDRQVTISAFRGPTGPGTPRPPARIGAADPGACPGPRCIRPAVIPRRPGRFPRPVRPGRHHAPHRAGPRVRQLEIIGCDTRRWIQSLRRAP